MNLAKRVRSNVDYGKKLVRSGFAGAIHGQEAFLDGDPLSPFLHEAACRAWKQATLGACIGLLSRYLNRRPKPATRVLAYGALGGAIGFGAGLTFRTHRLAASMGHGAINRVNAARDEHWLERHPINYA